jgi:2-polyprenyl-3-methyl-5-hydroxy-6-metoxy-1,4-benzoquinol methylase
MRDYNKEFQDGQQKKYAYDFDNVLRGYMMRALEPFIRPGKALELGCFQGEMTERLADRFTDLTVIEASGDLVKTASARLGSRAKFVHSTFETAQLTDRFDAIFLVHTLEHLDDPTLVLKQAGSWLSDTGRFFIVVPNANAPSRQIAVQMGLISHNAAVTDAEREHGHRVTYSLDTLEAEVRKAGLEITGRGGIFFKPLANFQFDKLMGGDIVSDAFLEGCYKLGMHYPDLCASVYVVCERPKPHGA